MSCEGVCVVLICVVSINSWLDNELEVRHMKCDV